MAYFGSRQKVFREATHPFPSGAALVAAPIEGAVPHAHHFHDEEERFKERIRHGPTKADGISVWRGASVMDMLKSNFDVEGYPLD